MQRGAYVAFNYGNAPTGPGGGGVCPQCGCPMGMAPQTAAWGQTWGGPYYGGMAAPMGPMGGPTGGWMQPPAVGPWGGGPGPWTATYTGTAPDDEAIQEMIYDSIDADPAVPYDSDITVDVTAGVATLTGMVPNKRIKHSAGDDAWWVPGVVDVNNQLQISGRRARMQKPAGEQQRT